MMRVRFSPCLSEFDRASGLLFVSTSFFAARERRTVGRDVGRGGLASFSSPSSSLKGGF